MFSSIAYHFKVAVKSMIKDKNAVGLLHNNASMEKWRNLNEKKIPSFAQFNYYEQTLDRWHGEGTSNVEPILDSSRSHNYLASTNLLEDGSYIRLKSLQLGYTLPKKALKVLGVQSLRFYVNAENVITFRKNTGFTPEIGGGILNGGVDNGGTYPIPSTYTAGLSFNF